MQQTLNFTNKEMNTESLQEQSINDGQEPSQDPSQTQSQ